MTPERVRVDVWLWRARLFKTRVAAARAVEEGAVRLSRGDAVRRVDKPATPVGPGDVLVVGAARGLLTVRIEALGVRRGPPAEAKALYGLQDSFLDGPSEPGHMSGAED